MQCPVCVEEGRTSRVEGGDAWDVTAMYCLSFSDEAGKWHHHDGTTRCATYACSNGHRWRVAMHQTCWCGWSGGDTAAAQRGDDRGVPLAPLAGDRALTWAPIQ